MGNIAVETRSFRTTITSNTALVSGQHALVDATAGAVTVTLPGSANTDAYLSVEKVDASLNTVVISGSIRGSSTTVTLSAQYQTAQFHWSGSTWRVLHGYGTPQVTGTNGTVSRTTDPLVTSDSSAGFAVGSMWVNTTTRAAFQCLVATVGAAVWLRLTTDVQIFTANGTWTKPAWATVVRGYLMGGGGAGGSGARTASGTACSGGAGGGGAGVFDFEVPASSLSATEAVVVGAGGVGGAAVTVNSTAGNPGGQGSLSTFGTRFRSGSFPSAAGGGAIGAASSGGGAASSNKYGANGGSGTSGAGGSSGGSNNEGAGPGGGSGGGISATPTASAGGTGGASGLLGSGTAGGTGGTSGGGAGGAGTAVTIAGMVIGGSGGAGGGSSTTTAGGAGGTGGSYGAGGGGGGSSLNGFASGAGGDGGPGLVVVLSL